MEGRLPGKQGISPLRSFCFHRLIQTCHLSSARLIATSWLFGFYECGLKSPHHVYGLPQLLGTGDVAA
uniref:Uncharacterized protein n=1 Tax=Arundo donax TaxID=35708 RepID=A0A0A9D9E2_ARUDO